MITAKLTNFFLVKAEHHPVISPCGGTGRRGGFKIHFRKEWGFKSLHGHHVKMRISYNGIITAFQAEDAGSIPAIRSNKNISLRTYRVLKYVFFGSIAQLVRVLRS